MEEFRDTKTLLFHIPLSPLFRVKKGFLLESSATGVVLHPAGPESTEQFTMYCNKSKLFTLNKIELIT